MPHSAERSKRDDTAPSVQSGIPGYEPRQVEAERHNHRQTTTEGSNEEHRTSSETVDDGGDQASKKKRGRGRPPKPEEEVLSERMTVRLTNLQMERIEQVAADMDISPSVAARRIIGRHPIDQKARQLRGVRDQLSEIGAFLRNDAREWIEEAKNDPDEMERRQLKILDHLYENLGKTTREL